MVVLIEGVLKLVPVLRGNPPVAFAYQLTVCPGSAVAPNVTDPAPQRVAGVVLVKAGVVTVIVTTLELSELEVQLAYILKYVVTVRGADGI